MILSARKAAGTCDTVEDVTILQDITYANPERHFILCLVLVLIQPKIHPNITRKCCIVRKASTHGSMMARL